MPIDPSIALGYRPPEVMSPAQMISLRNLQRQGQLQELQLAEQTRQVKNRNAMLGITSDPQNFDPQTGGLKQEAIQQIGQFDPAAMLQQEQARRLSLAELSADRQRQAAMVEKKASAAREMLPAVVNAYDLALERTNGNQQEAMRAASEARSKWIDELQKSGRASALGFTEDEIQRERAEQIDIDRYRALTTSPRDLQAPPKSRNRIEGEKLIQEQFNRKTGKWEKIGEGPRFGSMAGAGMLSDDAMDLAADQFLAGDPSAVQGYARNAQMRAKLQDRIAQRAKARGMSGADIATKVAEFQGMKAGERTLGTRTANIEMAVTEAQNVIPIALEASDKVDRTKYPTLNSVLLAAQKGTGDENVVRLATATNALVNIYSRAIAPSGVPTVSDKDHARDIISTAYSKGQFKAVTDIMQQEMAAARKSPGQVKAAMSGKGETAKAPQAALDYLKAHPEAAEQFKAKYGYLP